MHPSRRPVHARAHTCTHHALQHDALLRNALEVRRHASSPTRGGRGWVVGVGRHGRAATLTVLNPDRVLLITVGAREEGGAVRVSREENLSFISESRCERPHLPPAVTSPSHPTSRCFSSSLGVSHKVGDAPSPISLSERIYLLSKIARFNET